MDSATILTKTEYENQTKAQDHGLSLVESRLVYILQQNYHQIHDRVTIMIIFKPTYRPSLKNPLAQAA